MSIIGEMWEEDMWRLNARLQEFEDYLTALVNSEDTDVNMHAINILEEFKNRFRSELKQTRYSDLKLKIN